jgi:hypothetical protein
MSTAQIQGERNEARKRSGQRGSQEARERELDVEPRGGRAGRRSDSLLVARPARERAPRKADWKETGRIMLTLSWMGRLVYEVVVARGREPSIAQLGAFER